MGRRFGELLPHLVDELFEALLDLLLKEGLESAIAESFLSLLRKIHDEVGDQGARETLRPCIGIVGKKRIDRRAHPRARRSAGWRHDRGSGTGWRGLANRLRRRTDSNHRRR